MTHLTEVIRTATDAPSPDLTDNADAVPTFRRRGAVIGACGKSVANGTGRMVSPLSRHEKAPERSRSGAVVVPLRDRRIRSDS
jgi:hypothetical protein